MYGKFFSSTFTGSMFGAGPTVFAVWGYVIANVVKGQVELNAKLLAPTLGTSEQDAQSAIDFLCAPDANSRSKLEEGRRLVKIGQFAYEVPNHQRYNLLRNEDDRREYNRIKMRESRAKRKSNAVKRKVNDSVPRCAHTDTVAETPSDASDRELLGLARLATREP